MTAHPDQTTLAAFLDGRLAETNRLAVERHVEACAQCCEAMSDLPQDTLSAQLRDVETDAVEYSIVFDTSSPAKTDKPGIPTDLNDHPRYRILEPLGRGGMGVVYKAEHRMMGRIVALKVIDSRFIDNPQAIERFRNEVKAAGKLTHANIVRAYDAEQAGDLHFLVMEFVDGISLAELIRRNGPLPVQQACGVVRKVAHGLHHAFRQGMVHRDIKPQNIMVTQDGRVRILDFGLARLARDREPDFVNADDDPLHQMPRTSEALTLVGSILGTPDYIAPEQVMDAHRADTRADIYSLGCTCYFLLTGQPPYPHGSVMEKLAAHTTQTPTSIAELRNDVPEPVIRIVERMMAREPQDRFQTPMDLAIAVDAFSKRVPPSAVTTTTHTSPAIEATLVDHPPQERKLAGPDQHSPKQEGERKPTAAFAESARSTPDTDDRKSPGQWKFALVCVMVAAAVIIPAALIFREMAVDVTSSGDAPPEHRGSENRSSEDRALATSPPDAAPPAGDWIDLLPLVNISNAPAGHWSLAGDELNVDAVEWARVSVRYEVPDEYDMEATFTRHTGVNSIALIILANGRPATLDIDAWENYLAGIQNIAGYDLRSAQNPSRAVGVQLVNSRRYTVGVRVRRDRIETYLNGEPLPTYFGDGSDLSLIQGWQLSDSNTIGIAAYLSATTFHQFRIRHVTGSAN